MVNRDMSYLGTSGAMISTLDDLHAWAQALGTGRLISPALHWTIGVIRELRE
jgi:hypothetical protein